MILKLGCHGHHFVCRRFVCLFQAASIFDLRADPSRSRKFGVGIIARTVLDLAMISATISSTLLSANATERGPYWIFLSLPVLM